MRVLIIGSLNAELGQAAQIAIAHGTKIAQADNITAALTQLRNGSDLDLILCDLAHSIRHLVQSLEAERISIPVVACGVTQDADLAAQAIRDGAREFLPLPPDPTLIAAILEAAAGQSHSMIARDPIMLATIKRAEQVAGSEASILIAGNSGTGKEIIAHHIHRRSRRAEGPFIALNCAAIPENLLESELFGHEKGAFSGAVARRIGKFEAAQNGTLLLDEISEMDVRLQAKLLRAIQEREIDRLGGTAPVRVNVRLLATTNRDLATEIKAGRFREDLYFRLNVVSLRIPDLADRPLDIGPSAEHVARHYAEINGVPFRPLSLAAQQRLLAGAWRGNVRELENTIHRAVLLASGPEIDGDAVEISGAAPAATPTFSAQTFVRRTMDEVERDQILQTLGHTFGNRTHAATILGISIRALRNKLRDYTQQGLDVPPPQAGIAA